VLLGAFQTIPTFAIIGALGVILAAVYMLWMYQRVMFGEMTHEANTHLTDLTLREVVVLVPVVLVIVWIGLYPQPFLKRMEASTRAIIERVVTVAQLGAARTMAVRCPEVDQMRSKASINASRRRGLTPETCRESRHLVPETEG
jgi:NADH-quinone oxidoreductase subunit M